MTKAVIIDQHGDGEYTVQVEDDTSNAQKNIDSLAKQLIQIEQQVLDASIAVLDAEAALKNTRTDLDQIIETVLITEGGAVDDPRIKTGVTELQAAANVVWKALNVEANLKASRASIQAMKTALENSIAVSTRSPFRCYCADYTEDLEIDSAVAMCLVPGEDVGYTWTVRPGYEDKAVWDYETRGQLAPGYSMTPSAFFYNLAMLPGWQRWLPTYRFGLIQTIHDDGTVDVLIDEARSSQKNYASNTRFNVNLLLGQPTLLERIPVKYMYCHWRAFDVEDHVVVEFKQTENEEFQTIGWGDPTVIGFVERPKVCLHFHEIGLCVYHDLALGNSQYTSLIYPEAWRDLLAPYGGVPGEMVTADPPLWLDYNGTVGGVLGSRFRVYEQYMRSLAITDQRAGPTRVNRYDNGQDYKQLALPNKLKFMVASNMGADQVPFSWQTPYCRKPNVGTTYAIFTDIVYPNEAREDLPARLEYWLIYFGNASPIRFYRLSYDGKNAAVIAARDAFFALGRADPADTDAVKFQRLRAESIVAGAVEAPDWQEIGSNPDYVTPVDWLVAGNSIDYGVHVSWNGERFGLVVHTVNYNGGLKVESWTGRLYLGTIKKNHAAEIDGRVEFSVNWKLTEEKDWTGQVQGDKMFYFDPTKKLHIYKPFVPDGEGGAYQTINEPRAPVYCFYDLDDRFNLVLHERDYDDTTFQPQPPNWNTFQDEIYTCSPLTDTAVGFLEWRTNNGYDTHGFFLERETTPGAGNWEGNEVWRHTIIEDVGQDTQIFFQQYGVWASDFYDDVLGLDVTDQWWGDNNWSCNPDPEPFPPQGTEYKQTSNQGTGNVDAQNGGTSRYFRSYLILPGYDGSKVFSGYQIDLTETANHNVNHRDCAIAVTDSPGDPPVYPPTNRVMQWKMTAQLDNFKRGGSIYSETYLANAPRWRVDGKMILTGARGDEPIETASLTVWINRANESEPETTYNLQPGESPQDALDRERGKWGMFDRATNNELWLPEAFRAKWSTNAAGYYMADFNADDPDLQQGRTDNGLPAIYHWDFVWMGSS